MQQHNDAGVRGSVLLHLWQAGMGSALVMQEHGLSLSRYGFVCDVDIFLQLVFISSACLSLHFDKCLIQHIKAICMPACKLPCDAVTCSDGLGCCCCCLICRLSSQGSPWRPSLVIQIVTFSCRLRRLLSMVWLMPSSQSLRCCHHAN